MAKVGVLAGGGRLPVEFAVSAREKGERVVAFALKGVASADLEKAADKVYWLDIGQYKKFVLIQLKERLGRIALLGKVPKQVVYSTQQYDDPARKALKGIKDNKDYSLMREITRHFGRFGVEVIDPREYLEHIVPDQGLLTGGSLSEDISDEIKFGCDAARCLAGADIGQTVVVKKRAVVSVEAMEGTDAVIERSYQVAGEGCIMVKLSRPDQDMRWDIPVIGEETIEALIRNKFRGVVIESRKMFFIGMKELLPLASKNGLFIQAV